MNSLRDMNQKMQTWMSEKPQGGFSDTNELRLDTGDVAFLQFVANGNEGQRYIAIYRSHIIPQVGKNGGRFNATRFCPVKSGVSGVECPLCAQGHTDIKERMSMWFYVSNILHAKLPQNKQFPQVNHQGNFYFNEEINAFKRWDTSAWKNSPWQDILRLSDMYEGLHNFSAQLECVGAGLEKRFKIYAIPNSTGITPELYARANDECGDIAKMLLDEVSSPVAINPNVTTQQTQQLPQVTPFVPPGQQTQVFTPAFQVAQTTEVTSAPTNSSTPVETVVVQEQPQEQTDQEEQRRPLKSMW